MALHLPVIVLALLLPLAGHAQSPSPDTEAQAKIRVHSTNRENTFVTVWDAANCEQKQSNKIAILGPKANFLADRGTSKRIGIPLLDDLPPKQTAEFFAPTGRPYYIEMRQPNVSAIIGSAVTYDWCKVTIKFTPEPGAIYEATYQTSPVAGSSAPCKIEFKRIVEDPLGSFKRVVETNHTVVGAACQD